MSLPASRRTYGGARGRFDHAVASTLVGGGGGAKLSSLADDAVRLAKTWAKQLQRYRAMRELHKMRVGLNMGTNGTLARLDVGGKSFFGINAHGQPITLRANPISATHAEADVMQQAANAGMRGGEATLYVDRVLCDACGVNGAVKSMARQLGIKKLTVVTREGSYWFNP